MCAGPLRSAVVKPIAVGRFKAAKPGQSTITCRAAGPVTVSPSFEACIEKAFIDDLKLAGVHEPSSTLVLTGKLEEVDFSSGISDGNWMFTLEVTHSRNESLTTKSKFNFSGSFVADKACQELAQAFSPAVQRLVEDVIRDPTFKQIAN